MNPCFRPEVKVVAPDHFIDGFAKLMRRHARLVGKAACDRFRVDNITATIPANIDNDPLHILPLRTYMIDPITR